MSEQLASAEAQARAAMRMFPSMPAVLMTAAAVQMQALIRLGRAAEAVCHRGVSLPYTIRVQFGGGADSPATLQPGHLGDQAVLVP